MICQKVSRATGSAPEVGSSRMSISGPWIMATARDRRWRWPSGRGIGPGVHDVAQAEALCHLRHPPLDALLGHRE